MTTPILTIPGLWNSGPEHWQTYWEAKHPFIRRVEQRDFSNPDRSEWVANLEMAVTGCDRPPVLAAHSLGCSLVGQWSEDCGGQGVLGAFLVAPSDVEAPDYPVEGRTFSYMPLSRLPFPSIVVASSKDQFVSIERANEFAKAWGSRLVIIGDAGHINAASGHGPWPEGEEMLLEFCRSVS